MNSTVTLNRYLLFYILLKVDSSDKENSEGSSKQLEDVSRPSPVKQTKTEVVRSIPEPNKMEDAAAKEKSTMSIAKHEGMLKFPMLLMKTSFVMALKDSSRFLGHLAIFVGCTA